MRQRAQRARQSSGFVDGELFGDQPKPESRAEKRAKQNGPLQFRGEPKTMQDLWEARSSIQTKCVHWNTSGPFGGSTTHAACGARFGEGVEKATLVEHVTCLKCRSKAAKAWEAMARHSRGIDDGDEEE